MRAEMRDFHWQAAARWVWAGLLAAVGMLFWLRGHLQDPRPLLGVSAIVALYNLLASSFVGRRRMAEARVVLLTLTLDILALTTYLHFSGDVENPLVGAYIFPTVAGAVLLSRRSGFLLAGVSSTLFSALVLLTAYDRAPVRLQHYHLQLLGDVRFHEQVDPDLSPEGADYIFAHLAWLFLLQFGCAYGFGTLAGQIRWRERELRDRDERMEALLRAIPVGVVLVEPDGVLSRVNPAARRLIGGSEGKGLSTLPQPVDLEARLMDLSREVDFETTSGGRLLEHSLVPASPAGAAVWVLRDVTEQRRMMAQLVHQAKMADLGLLVAGIAHEVGNPLSSMSAILQLIRIKDLAPEIGDRLTAVEANIERIRRIVGELTGFARPGGATPQRAGVSEIVAQALGVCRYHEKARHTRIEVSGNDGDASVRAFSDQIVQVVLNLVLNAADASPQGGAIRLSVRASECEVRIAVSDDGPGITDEARRHLFTPFFTTKDPGKGTGLGLFVSDSIVRAHGGRIEVESPPGQGATFTVVLPRACFTE